MFSLPLQPIAGKSLRGGAGVTYWKNNKRLLLFGIALKCRKFQISNRMNKSQASVRLHGRDLSGLVGILQPQSMGEIIVRAFLL